MDFSIISINELQEQSNYLLDIGRDVISILLSAMLGWKYYKWQQKEILIKDDYIHINSLLNSIILNLEYATAVWDKVNKSMSEIDNYIKNLEKLKYFLDCKNGLEELDIIIQFVSEEDRNKYIDSEIKKLNPKFVCVETFIQIIGSIQDNTINREESLLLSKWGDYFYKKLYLLLFSYYNKTNECIKILNDLIKTKTLYLERECIIPICNETNYQSEIPHKIQEFLYIKNYYEQLQYSIEHVILYSDLIQNRLIVFNKNFLSKFSYIIKNNNLPIYNLEIKEKDYNIENLSIYKNFKDSGVINFEPPEYKLLQLNVFDKFRNKMHKLKNRFIKRNLK